MISLGWRGLGWLGGMGGGGLDGGVIHEDQREIHNNFGC